MKTRVFLVDDHAMFRGGLRLLLEREKDISVVGEAGDGQAALDLVGDLAPDVIVMDISMPDLDGIEATRRILSEAPETKIIALSIHSEKGFVQGMLIAGAVGYILKESVPEEVVDGIRAVRGGGVYLSAAITDIVVSGYRDFLSGAGALEDQSSESSSIPLPTAKLHRPPISQRVVVRTRLIELLEAGRWKLLTLVSAPAGYGKSTLVSQWLDAIESDCPGAWLSLDEGDNDLRMFTTNLVAAVQTQFPEALQGASRLLKAPALPPLPVLVRQLVNELDHVPQRFILVLDDYQHIVEPSITELLAELLRHSPKTLHLVLVTRSDPSLDLLKLQSYQQIGEVRAQALSFTVEETEAFLQKVVGTAIDQGVANALFEKTEGWVTGLHLMTLSAHDMADLFKMSSTLPGEQQTLDYLAAEALSHQTRDVQAWLLKTSILDRFCAPLCEAVCLPTEESGASSLRGNGFIQWLLDRNLFVIPLDYHGHWVRYHPLFQELLQSQLENALDAEEIAALHTRACRWLAENGQIEEAIEHALAAGDETGAAQVVEQYRQSVIAEDKWYILEKWLSILPEIIKQQRPVLLVTQAYVYLYQHNLTAILSTIERAEQILGSDGSDLSLWGEINFLKGYLCWLQGQGSSSEEYLERAIDQIPDSNHYCRGEAELHYTLALHMSGKKERAILELNNWLRSKHHLTRIRSTRLWAGLYYIQLLEGNLPAVLYPAGQCLAIASKDNNVYVECWSFYMQACVYFLQNDQVKAVQKLSWLVEQRFIMHARAAIDSLCGLALLYQMEGQPEKADKAKILLREFSMEKDDPAYNAIAESCLARLSLMQADLAPAVRWLQTADLTLDADIMLWWIELPRITACRVLIAEGSGESLQEAIDILRDYQKENQALHNTYQVIVILSLLTLAYHKQEGNDQALEVLEEVLDLGLTGGWIWPFIELGSPMADLLRRLKKGGVAAQLGDYIDLILAAFASPASSPGSKRRSDLIEPLTEREMQVLRLLISALSAGEIAEELVVSVNTVRMHTKNIYSKLDVHSRIEAVERARQLGLI